MAVPKAVAVAAAAHAVSAPAPRFTIRAHAAPSRPCTIHPARTTPRTRTRTSHPRVGRGKGGNAPVSETAVAGGVQLAPGGDRLPTPPRPRSARFLSHEPSAAVLSAAVSRTSTGQDRAQALSTHSPHTLARLSTPHTPCSFFPPSSLSLAPSSLPLPPHLGLLAEYARLSGARLHRHPPRRVR